MTILGYHQYKIIYKVVSEFDCICVCMTYVYVPEEADVPKQSRVHMGCVRPKINNAAVVY